MPIDIEEFERSDRENLRAGGPTNAERILSFLTENADRAYTPREIHDATGVARGGVGVVLSRLEDRGLVRHRGEYWAIADVDDVEQTITSMGTARSATERLGAEDPDDWGSGVGSEIDE